LGVVTFTTLNNQPVPRTAVIGRVFASELVDGSDTGTNALNRPLPGVVVTVDGQEESLRAVTDAQGNFRLEPAPAGRFFVHVDGRTAVGSTWPDGDYYPVVGKAWEAVAGRTDNLAGGTGEIYLPLIKAGSLQSVSLTAPTPVTFVPEVVAANPALAGVAILVPPGGALRRRGQSRRAGGHRAGAAGPAAGAAARGVELPARHHHPDRRPAELRGAGAGALPQPAGPADGGNPAARGEDGAVELRP
jgi:hypothetical protein